MPNDIGPITPPHQERGTMTLLLFHLQQAHQAVEEAQGEVRRCADAARAFYGDAWTWTQAMPYQTRHAQLQAVMDGLAAEGHQLHRETLGCERTP